MLRKRRPPRPRPAASPTPRRARPAPRIPAPARPIPATSPATSPSIRRSCRPRAKDRTSERLCRRTDARHRRGRSDDRRRHHLELHDQLRPPASGGARGAATGNGAGRGDHRAYRSARRPAAPWHRKADRSQDLCAGDPVFRSPRLLLAAVHGAHVRACDREAARYRGADPRPVSARVLRRADPYLEPHAEPGFARHGRRRDDAEPVAVRDSRGLLQFLRACLRRTDAPQLHAALPLNNKI
eukprot:TRINITY_DN6000_c0_g1_i1.p2 TRINITY_DN6000_c0_g1~~TRINITY_DN6000_c0_g1_i1.p2  ORF type:complete len:241 (-),score=-29.56 TRINITY_DN6000_c0_g1_i1:137-859(-)